TFLTRDLDAIVARLAGVRLVRGPAVDLIEEYDGPQTLFYCDPPYLPTTRTAPDAYRHEMTVEDHEELLEVLLGGRGAVYLSGYASPLYDEALAGWEWVDWDMPNHSGQGKRKQRRVERLWMNAAAVSTRPGPGDGAASAGTRRSAAPAGQLPDSLGRE